MKVTLDSLQCRYSERRDESTVPDRVYLLVKDQSLKFDRFLGLRRLNISFIIEERTPGLSKIRQFQI